MHQVKGAVSTVYAVSAVAADMQTMVASPHGKKTSASTYPSQDHRPAGNAMGRGVSTPLRQQNSE